MPHGNHHVIPSGIWYQNPATHKVSRLLLKSARGFALTIAGFVAFYEYRSMGWRWTYKSFIGKMMTFGTITTATHEPASVEYIDQLKRDMAEKRRMERMKN